MSRPRIWVITPALHRSGGTERCVAEEVERWADRFDLRVYSMEVGADVDLSRVGLRRIPRLPGPHLGRFLWWMAANWLVRGWDALHVGRPDALVSPGVNALAADVIGVHIVFSKYWERTEGRLKNDLWRPGSRLRALHRIAYTNCIRLLEKRAYTGPALLWALSKDDRRTLEHTYGRPPETTAWVPSGVDVDSFHPERRIRARTSSRRDLGVEGKRVVLLVGNDAWIKGVDLAARALPHLPEDVVLAVAGRIEGSELRRVGDPSRVSDRIRAWPHRLDPFPYYAAADVLVAPSRGEAFPLPPLEAMASGLPVVVSGLTGIGDLVDDGRDALIVTDPTDDVDLAARIREALDIQKAADLAREGRALAERCSWEVNAERAAALVERELRTPRVLVLAVDPGGTGGIQRASRALLGALSDLFGPDRVGTLAVWRRGKAAVPGRLLRAGRSGEGATGHVGTLDRARYLAASMYAARRWRRRSAIVAVHPSLAPIAWACHLVSGAPYAVWCHGEESWGRLEPAVARSLRAADLVFAPSRFTARRVEQVAGLAPGSVRVVPHCVPPEAGIVETPTAIRVEPPVVLTVARLAPEHRYKGVDTLLHAWPRVREKIDATLVVVGDGPDLPHLRLLAERLHLDGAVRFAGRLSDDQLAEAYSTASVFAMPARHQLEPRPEGEGFGLVYVEAAAAGLPVVAGEGGGAEDAVEDGGSGLLVNARDVDAVADAIVRLLSDGSLASRMGQRGRDLAAGRFSYGTFRERVGELVRDLAPKGLR